MATNGDGLNEFQERRLSVTCRHIDKLLSDVEAVLSAPRSKTPFPKYVADIPGTQRRAIEDSIARIRACLVHALETQGIAVEPPSIPASHSVHTTLTFIEIAAEELRPRNMRGYGPVSSRSAAELNQLADKLQALVSELDRAAGAGLAERGERK